MGFCDGDSTRWSDCPPFGSVILSVGFGESHRLSNCRDEERSEEGHADHADVMHWKRKVTNGQRGAAAAEILEE